MGHLLGRDLPALPVLWPHPPPPRLARLLLWLLQTDWVSFLPLKCKSNSQVCTGRSSLPTSTWPPPSLLCAFPRGRGPRARGSRKEAEQAGPVPLPGQGMAGPGPQRRRRRGQALGERAAGRPVTWAGTALDVLRPAEDYECPLGEGSGQGLDQRAGCSGPREASCTHLAKAASLKISVLLL